MDRNRPRVAIGVFATIGDAEATMARLHELGIMHHECFSLPPDQTPPLTGPQPASEAHTGPVMLRIYLQTMADEQPVVAALLSSAAQSVQLHDVDPAQPG